MNKNFHKYSNWLRDKKIHFLSKSKCHKVLSLYEFILENEFVDSDYWYSVGGDEINKKLLSFTRKDWINLEEDLKNWSSEQLEAFSLSITNDDSKNKFSKDFLSKKSYVFTYLLTFCEDELFIDLINDIYFLKYNENKNFKHLEEIKTKYEKITSKKLYNKYYSNHDINHFINFINNEKLLAKKS